MFTKDSDRCLSGRLAFNGKLRSSPLTFGRVVGDQYSKGLVEQGPSSSQVTSFFFVPRKDKTMRLIFDTREANTHFREPPFTSVTGVEALASVEVPPGCKLTKAQVMSSFCFLPLW